MLQAVQYAARIGQIIVDRLSEAKPGRKHRIDDRRGITVRQDVALCTGSCSGTSDRFDWQDIRITPA